MVNEQGPVIPAIPVQQGPQVVDEEPVGETSEWEEGPVVEMKPDEALALVQEEDQVEFSGQGKEKTIEAEAEVGEVNKSERMLASMSSTA